MDYKTLKKKIKQIQRHGNISDTLGLEKNNIVKWQCYPKQCTGSIQSLNTNGMFHRTTKEFQNLQGNTKDSR